MISGNDICKILIEEGSFLALALIFWILGIIKFIEIIFWIISHVRIV